MVQKRLEQLNCRKADSSDDIPSRLLIVASDILSGPLTHIYNMSTQDGIVPRQWKSAKIHPVPKCRNPSLNDIRPISLLPVISKILERLVADSMMSKLIELYGPNQYGFRPNSSTCLANIKLHDYVTELLERKNICGVIVLSFDLTRAFDKVRYDVLLRTLLNSDLPHNFVRWIKSYLQNRKQFVSFKDVRSSNVDVASGVPQGSILGPYLFGIFIGSLAPAHDTTCMIKYADDIALVIPHERLSVSNVVVNEEIENVRKWTEDHAFQLNTQKPKFMFIDKSRVEERPKPLLKECHQMKILGIKYDNNLKWTSHIHDICKKASQCIYLLRSLRKELTKKELVLVYNNLIRSVLEYNAPVFVGVNQTESAMLERIQRRCHRIICGNDCKGSQFSPLSARRSISSQKLFMKIQKTDNLLHRHFPNFLQNHASKLMMPVLHTRRRAMSFFSFLYE